MMERAAYARPQRSAPCTGVRPLPPIPPCVPMASRRNSSPYSAAIVGPRPLPTIPLVPRRSSSHNQLQPPALDIATLDEKLSNIEKAPSRAPSPSCSISSTSPSSSRSSSSQDTLVTTVEPVDPILIKLSMPSPPRPARTIKIPEKLTLQTSPTALKIPSPKEKRRSLTPVSPLVYAIPSPATAKRRYVSRLRRHFGDELPADLTSPPAGPHPMKGARPWKKEEEERYESIVISTGDPDHSDGEWEDSHSIEKPLPTAPLALPLTPPVPITPPAKDRKSGFRLSGKGYSVTAAKRRSAKWIRVKRGRVVDSDYADIISALRQL